MNILFTRFPLESVHGGTEIQTLSLMKGLVEKGHSVSFLGSCSVLLKQAPLRGVEVYPLHVGEPPVTKWGAVSFAWRQKKLKADLMTAMKKMKVPDAVCMLSLSEKIVLTQFAASHGSRVFWIEHDRVGRWLTMNPWFPSLKKAGAQATVICVSELSRKLYVDLGFEASHVAAIPNGIDLQRFADARRTAHAGSPLNVGCIARLSPEKGIEHLIDAARMVPGIHVTIVGKGRERQVLADRIETAGLTERVRILDAVPDLGAFYASLDIFVLPSSDHDPFGLVAAEAISMGTATVVTDLCGIAGYLDNGENCVIAKAGDSASLAAAIRSLVTDDDRRLRIAAAGKTAAEKLFSVEKMVRMYEELFR